MLVVFGIRHGECDRDKWTQKYIDDNVGLNENGKKQIRECSKVILTMVYHAFDRFIIYTSPVYRVVESAFLLMESLKVGMDWEGGDVRIDSRLFNKQEDETMFAASLDSFLNDVRSDPESERCMVLVMTHGRILKMLSSLCRFGKIDCDYTHCLEDLSHGQPYMYCFR